MSASSVEIRPSVPQQSIQEVTLRFNVPEALDAEIYPYYQRIGVSQIDFIVHAFGVGLKLASRVKPQGIIHLEGPHHSEDILNNSAKDENLQAIYQKALDTGLKAQIISMDGGKIYILNPGERPFEQPLKPPYGMPTTSKLDC